MVADMEEDTGGKLDPKKAYELWANASIPAGSKNRKPTYHQVISPYRGEETGIEQLIRFCRRRPTETGWRRQA